MSCKGGGCESAVARFYDDKVVFITGGTGFMGKVIVEKLLHACPGISKVYVLVRSKKGEDKDLRLDKIKNGLVFKDLRTKYPERLNKLQALDGDIELPGLGLSEADKLVLKQVNVIFNVAATINFNEDLRKAVRINILATKTLLEMAAGMKGLKSFVHVSTAYSNSNRRQIEERVYPAPMQLQELLDECSRCPENQIAELTQRVLGDRQNTYVLTKALAENVVQSYGDKFPVAIVRPSIVTAAQQTPYPGWVDCRSGCTGLLSAAASGTLRMLYAHHDIVLDIIPVDLVDNLLIVVAWKTAMLGAKETVVYNAVSGAVNKCTLEELFQYILAHSTKMPHDTVLWYPELQFTRSRLMERFGTFWLQKVPAFIYDNILARSGKVRMTRVQQTLDKALKAIQYFGCTEFLFSYDNVPNLVREMSGCDLDLFPIDVAQIDWFTYTAVYAKGIRKYLLNLKDENLPAAREKMQTMYIIDRVLKIVFYGALYVLFIYSLTSYTINFL